MKKLWVVDHWGYADPFRDTFEFVDSPEKCDVIMLTGGSDILPSHYGEKENKRTYTSPTRDKYELEAFNYGKQHGKGFLGICRGAQLLTALAGGKVIQHIDNHTSTHSVVTVDGKVMLTSSLHHQMMYPWPIQNWKLLAWADVPRSGRYLNGDDENIKLPEPKEPEVTFYPDIKALCIQGHPEMMSPDAPFVQWCNQQAKELL